MNLPKKKKIIEIYISHKEYEFKLEKKEKKKEKKKEREGYIMAAWERIQISIKEGDKLTF